MGSGHGATPASAVSSRRVRRVVAAVVAPMIAITAVALLVLWPRTTPPKDLEGQNDRHDGTVVEVRQRVCAPSEIVQTPAGVSTSRCGTVTVRVDDGPDAGRSVTTAMPDGLGAPTVKAGDAVVLLIVTDVEDPSVTKYTIVDHQRGFPLLWLAVLAAVAIVGFARWRGLAALAGLAVSFAVLLLFVLPAVTAGKPPLPVAVAGAAAIMFVVLYLTHGISVRTSIAVLGTLASLVLTGVLGLVAAAGTHLTGYGTEEATSLAVFFGDVDLHGLLLAGIIIGSLGVLDDVTVTQAATVAELAQANPSMSRLRLYQAAERVGRAHIASVVNTIVLAYAGASLPVLLLIAGANRGLADTLTTEFVAQEIVRSVVATIGLVAAVPITTGLAVLVTAGAADRPAARPRPATEPAAAAVPAARHRREDPWDEQPELWPDTTGWR